VIDRPIMIHSHAMSRAQSVFQRRDNRANVLLSRLACSLSAALIFSGCGLRDDGPAPAGTVGTSGGTGVDASGPAAGAGGGFATGSGGAGGSNGTAGSDNAGGASGSSGAAGSGTSGSSGAAGSGGASGSSGAAGASGAADGGLSDCVTAGTELCDDFESGQLDAKKWKTNKPTGSASITLDALHVHSGQYAVHIKVVPGQQTTAMITESVTFPTASNSFYARMFAYFSPDIPAAPSGDFHTGFLMGSGNNNLGNCQAAVGLIGSAKQFLGYSIFFANPKYEFGPWSATKVTPNQWLCIELFEDGSNPATEVRQIWVNGTELTDLRSSSAMAAGNQNPNHLPPKFDLVSFGLWEYHPIPTLSDMWIDDVRVSSKKIGCAN
jgi:hypothetical protein